MIKDSDSLSEDHEYDQNYVVCQQNSTKGSGDDLCVSILEDPVKQIDAAELR